MKNKKIVKVLALSVLSVFALTACDEIIAKPTQYEEQLITTPTTFNDKVYNNIASVVYDAIHDNGIGGDVLNQVLYLYAVSAFGPYNGNVVVNNEKVGTSEITLFEAARSNDATKMNTFVQNHKAYWDSSRTDASAPASENEKQRVTAKLDTIEDRIAEEMYNKISGGSYTDRHLFSEKQFLKSLRSSLESVSNPNEVTCYDPQQILPEFEPEQVFDHYLHREFYDSNDNSYIVDEIIPSIYSQLLAEQYILDETPNTLGRSYARQVNIIKFTNNSNYPNNAYYLAKELVNEINADPENYANGKLATRGLLQRFKDYSNAQIGNVDQFEDDPVDETKKERTNLIEILTGAGIQKGAISSLVDTYYLGTDYGDLAEKYIRMKDVAQYGVNSEYENTFTNNNSYPTYVGLHQETLALNEKDSTTTGWYIKNGGLTELPEAVRSRLFNIGVATGVKDSDDEKKDPDNNRQYVDGAWQEAKNENAYVCRINGHYYLKTASRVKGDPIENDILHYDADSKAYYIVEIEQAVSSSKLSKTSDRNYEKTISLEKMQEITNEVAKIVGKGESYSTLATKKYLKAMNIEYHDQSVYDYFKSNYPELFDEDASASEE